MKHRLLLALLAVLAIPLAWSALTPPRAWAQLTEGQAEARYLRAVAEFEAVREELERLLGAHGAMMNEFTAVRRTSGERAADDLFRQRRVAEMWALLQSLDAAARERREEVEDARRVYLQVLDGREGELLDRLDGNPPPGIRTQLEREIARIRAEYRRVEREREPLAEVMLRPVPNLVADPRDRPSDLLRKASYLEDDVAEGYTAIIAVLDREIADRERRLQQERARGDFFAGLRRFETDLPPATSGGARSGGAQPDEDRATEAGAQGASVFAELPLTEQVEHLRSIRAQAVAFREDVLERARTFRIAAGG